jgi:FkbM family methyltransferase
MNIKFIVNKYSRKLLPKIAYQGLYSIAQTFVGTKDKDRISRLSKFTKPDWYSFELDSISFPIYLDPENSGVDHQIVEYGYFEKGILNLFKKELKKDDTFLDIGANIGQHSLYASHFANQVYAFEPIQKIYDQFLKSVEKNQIKNIQVFNYGIGKEEKKMPIYGTASNMGASTVFKVPEKKFIQEVNIVPLDELLQSKNINKVDFIKIDVEGYEWEVLQGAQKTIKQNKPKMIIEFSPHIYNKVDVSISENIYNFLLQNGYTLFDVDNDGSKCELVTSFEDIKDLDQTNLFCVSNIV